MKAILIKILTDEIVLFLELSLQKQYMKTFVLKHVQMCLKSLLSPILRR